MTPENYEHTVVSRSDPFRGMDTKHPERLASRRELRWNDGKARSPRFMGDTIMWFSFHLIMFLFGAAVRIQIPDWTVLWFVLWASNAMHLGLAYKYGPRWPKTFNPKIRKKWSVKWASAKQQEEFWHNAVMSLAFGGISAGTAIFWHAPIVLIGFGLYRAVLAAYYFPKIKRETINEQDQNR